MAISFQNLDASMHAKTLRAGSQSRLSQLDAITAGSHMVRMAAKTDRSTTCAVMRQVMALTDTSQKAIAHNAEQSESVISDALSANGQRNFALEWLLDQDDAFLLAFFEYVMTARSLTSASRRKVIAEDVGRLVTRILEYAS